MTRNNKDVAAKALRLANDIKLREVAKMEAQSNRRVRIQFVGYGFLKSRMKKANGFLVYLDEYMDIDEIEFRMYKGFGDLK